MEPQETKKAILYLFILLKGKSVADGLALIVIQQYQPQKKRIVLNVIMYDLLF